MGVAKFWCEKQAGQEFKNRVIKVSNSRGKRKKKSKTKQLQSNNLEAKTIREAYRSATSGFYNGKSFLNKLVDQKYQKYMYIFPIVTLLR